MKCPRPGLAVLLLVLLPACVEPSRSLAPAEEGMPVARLTTWTISVLPLPSTMNKGEAAAINAWGIVAGSGTYTNTGISRGVVWRFGLPTIIPALTGTTRQDARATDLNEQGVVVGYTQGATANRSWKWSLAAGLSEITHPSLLNPVAYAINNAGTIVGVATVGGVSRGFTLSASGTLQFLYGGTSSDARDINDLGQVAGTAANGGSVPVRWSNGTPTYLGTLGGSLGAAFGISDQGYVVGFSMITAGGGTPRPFITTSPSAPGLTDLGTPPGTGFATKVSNLLRSVGRRDASGTTVAFTVRAGSVTTLPSLLPGDLAWANAVNSCGEIVGSLAPQGSNSSIPVLWSPSACDQDPNAD